MLPLMHRTRLPCINVITLRSLSLSLSLQPNAPAAIEMIAQQPVIKVAARVACCDGGNVCV